MQVQRSVLTVNKCLLALLNVVIFSINRRVDTACFSTLSHWQIKPVSTLSSQFQKALAHMSPKPLVFFVSSVCDLNLIYLLNAVPVTSDISGELLKDTSSHFWEQIY